MKDLSRLRKNLKQLLKISVWSAVVLLIIILISGFLAYLYRDELQKKVVQWANDQLKVPVKVSKIEFSVWKSFPDASVEFLDVLVPDVINTQDTFLFAGRLSFSFNIYDLFQDKYILKAFSIEDGNLRIFFDQKLNFNGNIFKDKNDSAESGYFSVDLKKVNLKNIRFEYIDQPALLTIRSKVTECHLTGNLSSDKFTLSQTLELEDFLFDAGNIRSKLIRKIELNGKADILWSKQKYSFNNFEGKINRSAININGYIEKTGQYWYNQIRLRIAKNNFENIYQLIPEEYLQNLPEFVPKGKAALDIIIKGQSGDGKLPSVIGNYWIENASLNDKEKDLYIHSIVSGGNFRLDQINKQWIWTMVVDTFAFKAGNSGEAGGHFTWNYHRESWINGSMHVKMDARDWLALMKWDSVWTANGDLEMTVQGNFLLSDKSAENKKQWSENILGTLKINLNDVRNARGLWTMEKLQADAHFTGKHLMIDSLKAKTKDTDVYFRGYLFNIVKFGQSAEVPLEIGGKLVSNKIDIENLLIPASNNEENKSVLRLPANIIVKANLEIKHIQWENWKANNFYGFLSYNNQSLQLKDVKCEMFSGRMTGDFQFASKKTGLYEFASNTNLQQIDIRQMLWECKNFGQDFITDKNLQGKADLTTSLRMEVDSNLQILLPTIQNESQLIVSGGQLKNFEPIYKLSRFIDLEELKNIVFQDLQMEFYISNQKIVLPKTQVRNSLMDITVSGYHTFDHQMDYHIELYLSDLLWRRARQNKKENEEFAVYEPGNKGSKLFLRIYGTIDDFKVVYDKNRVKEKWNEDWQKEKENVKKILKNEWNQNDSTINRDNPPKDLKFEWEENPEKTTKKENPKKQNPRFLGKEIKKNEKEKEEIEWE